jgi:U3 small nucleolar RNA-associated protein 20
VIWKALLSTFASPEINKQLEANLISADSALRQSTLRVLASNTSFTDEITSPKDIWAACLQVELSDMTLKNVRERTSNIARLTRLLLALPKDPDQAMQAVLQGAINYIIGQLKVNFRPLYPEITSSLAALVPKHGDSVWTTIWSELQKTNAAEVVQITDLGADLPDWTKSGGRKQREELDIDEGEGEFRCRSLEKSILAVDQAWSQPSEVTLLDADEIAVSLTSVECRSG